MSNKAKTYRKPARKSAPKKSAAERPMSARAMRKALRELMRNAVPSLPAPPGTVPPARWVSVRQAARWRKEIERDRRAGKPLPDFSKQGILTLRRFAEGEAGKLNSICIMDDLTLVRFVGVGEDEDDFYHVVECLGVPRDKRRMYYSAVGRCQSLRGRLDAAIYEWIEQGFTRSGCKPVRRMLILREVRGSRVGP